MRLKDKVIIITGGGQGIGKVYAEKLAEEGAKIVIAEMNEEKGMAVAERINTRGRTAVALKTDVTDEASTQAMARDAVKKFGRIDVLVNNAAAFSTLGTKPFQDISVKEWDMVMAVNLRGPFLCVQAVASIMKEQKKGKIINTSSDSWNVGRSGYLHYITSKAGTVGMTNGLAKELGDWNINVNAVSYAGIKTEIERATYTAEHSDFLTSQQAIKRRGVPEELVGTLIFLASEDSDFLTGQTIHVNGGLTFFY